MLPVIAKPLPHAAFQDAYHDLMHEIDGIPERVMKECLTWTEAHANLPTATGSIRAEEEIHD